MKPSCVTKTVEEILREKFVTPDNQRTYEWGRKQWEDFWNDLKDTVDRDEEFYYFGPMISYVDNGVEYLQEGQQRLTTCYILVEAIGNALRKFDTKISDENKARSKFTRYLIHLLDTIGYAEGESYDQQELNFHVKEAYHEEFLRLLCRDTQYKKNDEEGPVKQYHEAQCFFDRRLKDLIKAEGTVTDKIVCLQRFADGLLKKFIVTFTHTDNRDAAYKMFETTNARGLSITAADCLNNYFLQNTDNSRYVADTWKKLEQLIGPQNLADYIKAYWNTEHTKVTEKALFQQVKRTFAGSREMCSQFLSAINNLAPLFADMLFEDSDRCIVNKDIRHIIQNLRTLKMQTWRPVLLAMYRKRNQYSDADIIEVLKKIEGICFRCMICSANPNQAEMDFAALAVKITQYALGLSEILKYLDEAECHISDEVFKTALDSFAFRASDSGKIRYVFRKFHEHFDRQHEINTNNFEVHIEHIMPQTQGADWKHISEDDHADYLWKLGNLCLLSGSLNSAISNNSFEYKKKEAYAVSKIAPNSDLLDYQTWDIATIQDRQNKLAEAAVEIWS